MPHRFVVRIGQHLHTFDRYEDIPSEFDHVIEFRPEIPPPPHTDQQHAEIEAWEPRFQRLMEIEHARSSKTR
jgi:hypothetical protein